MPWTVGLVGGRGDMMMDKHRHVEELFVVDELQGCNFIRVATLLAS